MSGVLLLLVAAGAGLWIWLGRDDGPDYEADCRLVEETAPDLAAAQAGLLEGLQGGVSDDVGRAADDLEEAAAVFHELADGLTDRAFAEEVEEFAGSTERLAELARTRDTAGLMGEMQVGLRFLTTAARWLDEHCPRWLGPGQWGEPGTEPTSGPYDPTDLPSLPTEVPSDLPSLPTELPSIPELPTAPGLGGDG